MIVGNDFVASEYFRAVSAFNHYTGSINTRKPSALLGFDSLGAIYKSKPSLRFCYAQVTSFLDLKCASINLLFSRRRVKL